MKFGAGRVIRVESGALRSTIQFDVAHRSEVRETWGGEDIFEDFVRTELQSLVLEGKRRYHCCCLA